MDGGPWNPWIPSKVNSHCPAVDKDDDSGIVAMEHYDGINENGDFWSEAMNSFNHYAYGAVYDWIFANTLGIRRILPGYKKVEIKPIVDKRLGFASGSIETRYGKLASSWYYQDDHIVFEVDVPNQIEAIFVDNLGKRITLNKGKNRLYRIL